MGAMTALDGKALLDHGDAIARRYAGRIGAEAAREVRDEAVFRALQSPAPDGRIEPWLERIYRNLVIDRWRRPQTIPVDVDEASELATPTTPEDIVAERERRRRVRAGLRRLPRQSRRILLARYFCDIDETSAAARLGIAGTTVRTRIHRALARLRLWMGDLRTLCLPLWRPPLPGRLMGQLTSVGVAPILTAALVCGSMLPSEPLQLLISAEAESPRRTTEAFWRQTPPPHRPPSTFAPRPVHARKAAPEDTETPIAAATVDIHEVLWPDAFDVFAEPPEPAPPCLIERPVSFALQIEKMVEDVP